MPESHIRALRPRGLTAAGTLGGVVAMVVSAALGGCFNSSSGGSSGPAFDAGADADLLDGAMGDGPSSLDASIDSSAPPADGSTPDSAPSDSSTHDSSTLDSATYDSSTGADAGSDAGPPVLATAMSAIAITVDGTSVYWGDVASGGSVYKVPLGGGAVTTLTTNLGAAVYFLQHDATSLYVGLQNDVVATVPIGGGTPTTIHTNTNRTPGALAIDATSVYLTEDYSVAQNNQVVSFPKAGGTPAALATGGAWNYAGGVVVSAGSVYFGVGQPGAILSVPVGGGTTTTFASGQSPVDLAADATNLYWTDNTGGGSVMSAALSGAAPVTLATGTGGASAIAVDATSVYWSTNTYHTMTDTIRKVPIGGGSIVTLATGLNGVTGLAVDATSIYWVEEYGGVVRKASK